MTALPVCSGARSTPLISAAADAAMRRRCSGVSRGRPVPEPPAADTSTAPTTAPERLWIGAAPVHNPAGTGRPTAIAAAGADGAVAGPSASRTSARPPASTTTAIAHPTR